MSDIKFQCGRRNFVKKSLLILGALPFIGRSIPANAQELPTNALDPSDAMAIQLGYSEDTSKVDAAKFPRHQADQKCSGCALYIQGGLTVAAKEGEYGKCVLFQNGLVTANGWCNSFAPKAA